jgi:hypothetical protein
VGFALLLALSTLAAFAALAVTVRARLQGRAEQLVAATMLWNTLVVAPIYVLGLTHRLWPRSLAVAALVTSLAALALASRGVGLRALARDTVAAGAGLLRMPFDALALSARPFRFVFVGVLFTGLLLMYLALSATLGQQLAHWDPLWYHDPMVGFTIQNHGFAMVDLPDTLQKINGYVRLGEMTQLWLVIFSDRRLADLANVLFAPAIAAATYALARRYTGRVPAIGWGVATILMPACASYLHSTYVDPQNAALVLGGIVFSTLERPRLRDGALGALGLALAIGSKGLALVSVPVVGAIGAGVLLRTHWHGRRPAAIAVVVGGAVLVIGTAATTYVRNYLAFHNPLWPDMRVDIPALHIHWPGQGPWGSATASQGGLSVNLNESLPKLLDHLFALPWSIKGMYYDQAVEYGVGVVWVALPLGAVAFLATFVVALRRRLGHFAADETPPPLALAVILGVMIAGSPALWGPRYHTAHVALLFVLVAWFTRRAAWERLEEAAVAAVLVTSLMMFWWTPEPRWWMTPERLAALVRKPALERELDHDLGAPTLLATGLAREKELKPGTLLVFDEHYSGYPSLFWNNTFSNRIKYVRGGPGFLARAAQAGATWISLSPQDPQMAEARAAGSGWQEVGELNPIVPGFAFRRVEPRPPAPSPPTPPPPLGPPPPARGAAPTVAPPGGPVQRRPPAPGASSAGAPHDKNGKHAERRRRRPGSEVKR